MKNEILNDYIINGELDIDKLIDDFYGYVFVVTKNLVSIAITNEDIEEIIEDVFIAIWKNNDNLLRTTVLRPYLAGIARNVVKNKYRKTQVNFSISEYEENLSDNSDIQEIIEENEQDKVMQEALKKLKEIEYQAFMMYYYEAKSIKEISKNLDCSESKVKVVLHRVRKILKKNLEDGGYGYGK